MKSLTPQEAVQAFLDGLPVQLKRKTNKDWHTINSNNKLEIFFNDEYEFRIYHEMVTIGGISFPKPICKAPKDGVYVYITQAGCDRYCDHYKWNSDQGFLYIFLKRGLLHLTKENAVAHAKALIQLSGGNHE